MPFNALPGQDWPRDVALNRLFADHLRATGHYLLRLLQGRGSAAPLADDILLFLRAPDKLLGRAVMEGAPLQQGDLRIWALLALLTATEASRVDLDQLERLSESFWQRAHAAAAATELLATGIDLLDDLQDGDSPVVQQLGISRAVITMTALFQCAPLALAHSRAAHWPSLGQEVERLHSGTLGVIQGQYLDLQLEHHQRATVDHVMEMTRQKSGTMLALVCQMGAQAGLETNSERERLYVEKIGRFGEQLGTWSQLLNDLMDAEQDTGKSDRALGKSTLPLLLERQGREGSPVPVATPEGWPSRTAFAATFTVAETFRFTAQETLEELEASFGPHPLLWPLLRVPWEDKEPEG